MQKRFMAIWFPYLLTDWQTLRRQELESVPFVFAAPERNKIMITAVNPAAEAEGVYVGMAVADAKASLSNLLVIDHIPGKTDKLLRKLGLWCIRYTPIVAIDPLNGLVLDISGCTHLWNDERGYLKEIITKLRVSGYYARGAIADTIGAAWAISRFGKLTPIIRTGEHVNALLSLPPTALRLETAVLQKLYKLGFYRVESFINMPRSVLRRRFGENFLLKIDQALGIQDETIIPLVPLVPYQERLPSFEPIKTASGIAIAIEKLLEMLFHRLKAEGKGVRKAMLKCFCIDDRIEQVTIETNRATYNIRHLFKLFELKITKIEPALGIDLFLLEALKVEDVDFVQETLWVEKPGLEDILLAELLDRIAGKIGAAAIRRYLPVEQYWPERAVKPALFLSEKPAITWRADKLRPLHLLSRPEQIEVMALLPDYPPKVFSYKGKRHVVEKADGPERIEREWWQDNGEHRDYYVVEDAAGQRYWLFRSGHYEDSPQWFLHGFFA